LIDLKTRAVAPFPPHARTFHNIYKLQKHVLLRHQSYLIVFMGNTNLRFWQIMPLQVINWIEKNIYIYLSFFFATKNRFVTFPVIKNNISIWIKKIHPHNVTLLECTFQNKSLQKTFHYLFVRL
jgi:hypothetical protein